MYKKSKQKGNQASVQKLQRPRPEWTTDFIDNSKYRLSQAQMIQKKASLQSKNREIARQNLQERRKKLQMGIIDQDTRKVYETALTSKNIDINPPIRKNLSQMIQYEKEKKALQKSQNQHDTNKQQYNGDDFDQQIKNTQAFIKKMQRANKQGQIHLAVQILEGSTPRSPKKKGFDQFLSSKQLNSGSRKDQLFYDRSALEHEMDLQQTIKFMQETLFQKQKKNGVLNSFVKQKQQELKVQQQKQQEQCQGETNSFSWNQKQNYPIKKKNEFKISHLELPIQKKQDDIVDVDCMDTIRRMREMIESKEHLYDFGDSETMQKQNTPFIIPNYDLKAGIDASILSKQQDSNAQIDFSLTMNQSNLQSRVKDADFYMNGNQNPVDPQSQQFQSIKKTLFNQISKMKSMSFQNPNNSITVSSIQGETKMKKAKESAKKEKKPNIQLQKIKDMINGTKNNVDSLKVESLKLPKTSDMGFDFRGSINIKKNLVQ